MREYFVRRNEKLEGMLVQARAELLARGEELDVARRNANYLQGALDEARLGLESFNDDKGGN